MSRKLTISLCVLAYLTIAIVFFILFSGCAGQSGWHIGLHGYVDGEWKEAKQYPEDVEVCVGDMCATSTCMQNALFQHRTLVVNTDIEQYKYVIYRVENGKRYKVKECDSYYKILKWFDERGK